MKDEFNLQIFNLNANLQMMSKCCNKKEKAQHTCLEASDEEWTSFPKFPFNCITAVKVEL